MRFNTTLHETYRTKNGWVAIDGRDGSYRVFRHFVSNKKYVQIYWAGSLSEAVSLARKYAQENRLAFNKKTDYFRFVDLSL